MQKVYMINRCMTFKIYKDVKDDKSDNSSLLSSKYF